MRTSSLVRSTTARRALALGSALSTLTAASAALAGAPTVSVATPGPYVFDVRVQGGSTPGGEILSEYRMNFRFSDGSQFEKDIYGLSGLESVDFHVGARSSQDLTVSFQAQRVSTVGPFDIGSDWSNWVTVTAQGRDDGTIVSSWGTCIDVPFGTSTPGTLLQEWTCFRPDRNQQWTYDRFGHFSAPSGNVMDIYGFNTAFGAPIDTYVPNHQLNQIFYLTNQQILGMGDKCLDDAGYGGAGTLVGIYDCHGSPNQVWNYQNGQITGYLGNCLEADVNNLTDIRMAECTGFMQQTWQIEPGGLIKNMGTGRCMNLPNFDFDNSAPVQQGDCVATSTAEKWAWRGNITSPVNNGCLALANGNAANGTQIQMAQCQAGPPGQSWYFAP
jgi:hypothetical protein